MAWVTVADAKRELNKLSTVDDAELIGFVDAACAMIEDLKGHVAPVAVTWEGTADHSGTPDSYYGRRHVLTLPETPVLSVESVTLTRGGVDTVLTPLGPTVPIYGWRRWDNVLQVPWGCGPGTWYTIEYTVGCDPIPGNYRMAALELTAHLWQGSQTYRGGGRPQITPVSDQYSILPGAASAMPYRVRELLGIYGDPVSSHVVVA